MECQLRSYLQCRVGNFGRGFVGSLGSRMVFFFPTSKAVKAFSAWNDGWQRFRNHPTLHVVHTVLAALVSRDRGTVRVPAVKSAAAGDSRKTAPPFFAWHLATLGHSTDNRQLCQDAKIFTGLLPSTTFLRLFFSSYISFVRINVP